MAIIQTYRGDYFPAFPILDAEFAIPTETDWVGPITMLVDTGADVTILPQARLGNLRLPVEGRARLRTQWDRGPTVTVCRADIRIAGLVFPSFKIAVDRLGKDAILGRDVLSVLDIRLNGPAQQLHLLTR